MKRPKDWWHVILPDSRSCYVEAYTKSEARALAKRKLGPLPPGTKTVKVRDE